MKDTAAPRPTVLVVDPDPGTGADLARILGAEADVLCVQTGSDALKECQDKFIEVVLVTCGHAAPAGTALLNQVAAHWPETVLIARAEAEVADLPPSLYQICAPAQNASALRRMLRNAVQLFRVRRENDRMNFEMKFLSTSAARPTDPGPRSPSEEGLGFEQILRAPGSRMAATVAQARHLASFDVPVLITGAPGTGKRALAQAMHGASLRADRPFHSLDCAGLSADALRVELCGLRNNGASRVGLFQKAARGTLFLNGVDTLSPEVQMWLSHALRDGSFRAEGSAEATRLDLRLIAGSHADLRAAVRDGRFRGDLYHALALGLLEVPALSDRGDDLALLANHFLFAAMETHGKGVRGLEEDTLRFLAAYDWPGNLPELRNEITRMLILAPGPNLGPELISRHILQSEPGGTDPAEDAVISAGGTLKARVEEIERRILREVLTRLKWNKSRAASELGLSRVGLRAKLDRYGLSPGSEWAEEA